MGMLDSFSNDFDDLLSRIPAECTLAEAQYLYRKVAFKMGLHILQKFERDVVGPVDPVAAPGTGNPGGNGGGHPGELCKLVCFILELRSFR